MIGASGVRWFLVALCGVLGAAASAQGVCPQTVAAGGGVRADGTFEVFDTIGIYAYSPPAEAEHGFPPQVLAGCACVPCDTLSAAVLAALCELGSGAPFTSVAALRTAVDSIIAAQLLPFDVCADDAGSVDGCVAATLAVIGL